MKTTIFFLAAASLSLESFSAQQSLYNSTKKISPRESRIPVNPPLAYHYDSVKVISAFKYDHPVSENKQAYARIVYPVFKDTKLNNIVKSAVLSPLKVKHQFQNSLTAEHPALSNMDAVNNSAAEYHELASNFLRQFETQAPYEHLKAYWYADIQVKILLTRQDYTAVVCEKIILQGACMIFTITVFSITITVINGCSPWNHS
jgi:hypothetical protein